MERQIITTLEVCKRLNLSEPALRHILRRRGAPRPTRHPSARLFLWTEHDVERLVRFLSDDHPKGLEAIDLHQGPEVGP